jgi:hypothetical protein
MGLGGVTLALRLAARCTRSTGAGAACAAPTLGRAEWLAGVNPAIAFYSSDRICLHQASRGPKAKVQAEAKGLRPWCLIGRDPARRQGMG